MALNISNEVEGIDKADEEEEKEYLEEEVEAALIGQLIENNRSKNRSLCLRFLESNHKS